MALDVTPSLHLSVCLCLSVYAHAMEDRVQCGVSFLNRSLPDFLKQPPTELRFAGIIITRAPPLVIPSALRLQVCTKD